MTVTLFEINTLEEEIKKLRFEPSFYYALAIAASS